MRTTTPRLVRALGWPLVLAAAACGGDAHGVSSGDDGGAAATNTTSTMSAGTKATDLDDTRGTIDTSGDFDGVAFVGPELDCCDSSFECDHWVQDCPPGYKCMPWANDGGSSWNATRCSPIAYDPAQVGEPCHVEGSGVSGIDDCELGALCWYVDPVTNEGVCFAQCLGSEASPYCADPRAQCDVYADQALTVCLPTCDPLGQDCPEGQACYPVQEHWSCAPDASGELGAYGDPCGFLTECDSGLVCLDAPYVPPGQPCEGAGGCCTEVCDLDDPLGDAQCAGVAGGQTCLPWYENGQAPLGYEDVGACAVPQ